MVILYSIYTYNTNRISDGHVILHTLIDTNRISDGHITNYTNVTYTYNYKQNNLMVILYYIHLFHNAE